MGTQDRQGGCELTWTGQTPMWCEFTWTGQTPMWCEFTCTGQTPVWCEFTWTGQTPMWCEFNRTGQDTNVVLVHMDRTDIIEEQLVAVGSWHSLLSRNVCIVGKAPRAQVSLCYVYLRVPQPPAPPPPTLPHPAPQSASALRWRPLDRHGVQS